MKKFACPHCGDSHEGDPTDFGWSLPDDVWAIPESEREKVAKFDSDLCHYGDRWFIRSLLPISFQEREGYFGWGIWIEVEQDAFDAYLRIYETDGTNEPREPGLLANAIPAYNNSILSKVEIQFGTSDQRPTVYCVGEPETDIVSEQKTGISEQRYHDILESIGAI